MTSPAPDVATVESYMVKNNAILVTLDLGATKRWKNSRCVTSSYLTPLIAVYALDQSHVANMIIMACNAAFGF